MLEWLKIFNNDYANAVAAMTPLVIGVVSWIYLGIYKDSQSKKEDAIYIKPKFWSLRADHRIDTVKRFGLTADCKNYNELDTLYTPQSWSQYIDIKRSMFQTEIVPKSKDDILIVTLKRWPHERWKLIHFNR